MNITFGLLPPLDMAPRNKRARGAAYVQRALREMKDFLDNSFC